MAKLLDVLRFCDDYLKSSQFNDYGINGLQVEGKKEVRKIISGVSACSELFDIAIKKNADMILVHHGLFWGEEMPIKGVFKKRIKKLLDHDISLIAYHLPLDAHPEIGNNALIADRIDLKNREMFIEYKGNEIGVKGTIEEIEFSKFIDLVSEKVSSVKFFVDGKRPVKNIGIISGGARGDAEEVFEAGADTYITGEIGEPTKAFCEEVGLNYIALGHYASEIFGVRKLGEILAKHFSLDNEFIKLDNPH